MEKTCSVCAIGSIFLSYIRLKNKVPLDFLTPSCFSGYTCDKKAMLTKLRDAFSTNQMNLIEAAFEMMSIELECNYDADSLARALAFGSRYTDDKKRLRAILLNVVKNNGEFKP